MNFPCRFHVFLVFVFLASFARGQETSAPQIVSDERILFEKGRYTQTSGIKGAEVKQDPKTRIVRLVLREPDTGGAMRCLIGPTRLDPLPYLGDPAPAVDIVFRGIGQSQPESLYIVLEMVDATTKPGIRKNVRTLVQMTASAEDIGDGWKKLRLPFDKMTVVNAKDAPDKEWTKRLRMSDGKSPDITSRDLLERVQVLGTSPGALEVGKISLVRLRNISVRLTNGEAKNTARLEIEGKTSEPAAEVTLKIVDAFGRAQSRTAQAANGIYKYVWENPPVSVGKSSTLEASVGSAKNALDQSTPIDIFGFLPDASHVWLTVKGRDIVTSPASKGGSQPFYSVGVGYGKNVLVRGYDEEAAAYAKAMFLNTLRLAFYTLNFNSKADMPQTFDDITSFIDPVLTAAKRHGLYVILDDHAYFKNEINEEAARGEQKSDGWTEERFQRWVQRWVQVAEHYKDEPYILGYELCNEPVCSAETARKWYRKCIEAIREVDSKHIILVGTHHWSHSRALEATWRDVAGKIDEPYNNVVFSFHDYPQDDDPWKVQQNLRAFQDKYNVPVMCTEFGAGGKPERVHREFQAGMLAMFAFDRVGWMIWSLYYDKERASGYPTKAVQNPTDKTWEARMENPGYFIPFVELWAPTARIMGSPFPEAGGNN